MEETARKAEEKATELMDKLALVQMYRDNYGGKYWCQIILELI